MPDIETTYEGRPVRRHSAAVRGASGDALNGALKVAPQTFAADETAFLLLEVRPDGVNHKPIEGDDEPAWERMQILKVQRGAFIDVETATPLLDEVTIQLEQQREADTGQDPMFGTTITEIQHLQGLHKNKRKACPMCQGTATDEDIAKAEEALARQAEAEAAEKKPRRGRRK